jgi:methionyl-tRNA synthetase
MNELAFNKALQAIWELVSLANKYIDDSAPWALAKQTDQQDRLGTVLYNLCDGLRVIAQQVAPFMPDTGKKILEILACGELDAALQPGTSIIKAAPLFPRIETE